MYQRLMQEAITDLKDRPAIVEYYQGKKILITGGNGFIGQHVASMLEALGAQAICPTHKEYDLLSQSVTARLFANFSKLDAVFHLAATCFGIGELSANPGKSFYENLQMGLNVVEQARLRTLKTVYVGSVCSYPEQNPPITFIEENLWSGEPEPSNRAYGIAKKAIGEMLMAYAMQYQMKSTYVLMGNCYGPFDNFNLQTSHVIPALIRKFVEAQESNKEEVTVWGTGNVSRDFLYVTDAARGIVLGGAGLDFPVPYNLGSGTGTFIAALVKKVKEMTFFSGEVVWDKSKPDGSKRRQLNIQRAYDWLNWKPLVDMDKGLRATIQWYQANGK